jgi:translation initiation factor 3 subunit E
VGCGQAHKRLPFLLPCVRLSAQAKLNAKIDSKSGTVQMGLQTQSVHEQLIDKAKVLSVRTYVLANTVVGSR